ncbi:hypothetical protein DC522_11555 [Microvirga sp. KLBC 81]|nr:hypothetical protein DC522_11555 [Microvirga sp. KLBC 81]
MAGLVPAIPMMKDAALHVVGITGTRPVMTGVNQFNVSPSHSTLIPYPSRKGEGKGEFSAFWIILRDADFVCSSG